MTSRYRQYVYRKYLSFDTIQHIVFCGIGGYHNVTVRRGGPVEDWQCPCPDAEVQRAFTLLNRQPCCRQMLKATPPAFEDPRRNELLQPHALTPYGEARRLCVSAVTTWLKQKLAQEPAAFSDMLTILAIDGHMMRTVRADLGPGECSFAVVLRCSTGYGRCRLRYTIDGGATVYTAVTVSRDDKPLCTDIAPIEESLRKELSVDIPGLYWPYAALHKHCVHALHLLRRRAVQIAKGFVCHGA